MDFESSFAYCIRKGDVNGLHALCIDKSNVNEQFICPTPVPHLQGNFALPPINYPTPLIYSILCQQKLILQELLQIGADLNIPILNWYPIHYAVALRSLDLAREILIHDQSQANKLTNGTQNSPLHMAASSGNYQMVLLLLKYNANPNSCNSSGLFPIHSACFLPTTEILEALFTFGADTEVFTSLGETIVEYTEKKNLSTAHDYLVLLLSGEIDLPSPEILLSKLKIDFDTETSTNPQEKADLLEQRVAAAEELLEYQNEQ